MTAILVWGVIGYFAARMLLDKSFRVFGRWKGGLAVAAVFAALFCVVGFDLTGFETRIPDPAKVDGVVLYGLYAVHLGDSGDGFQQELDDPELLQLVNILHQAGGRQHPAEAGLPPEGGRHAVPAVHSVARPGRDGPGGHRGLGRPAVL